MLRCATHQRWQSANGRFRDGRAVKSAMPQTQRTGTRSAPAETSRAFMPSTEPCKFAATQRIRGPRRMSKVMYWSCRWWTRFRCPAALSEDRGYVLPRPTACRRRRLHPGRTDQNQLLHPTQMQCSADLAPVMC